MQVLIQVMIRDRALIIRFLWITVAWEEIVQILLVNVFGMGMGALLIAPPSKTMISP